MITANKGEWSELYVLFKLLGDKKLYAGDGNLNKLSTYYPVIKALRDECVQKQLKHYEYKLQGDIVILSESGNEIIRIPTSEFVENYEVLFSGIKAGPQKGEKGAFPIPSISSFLRKIECNTVKAKSSDKADIKVVIHDYHTGTEPLLKFSIKSEAGNKSSLLNPSAPTNMFYSLNGNIDESLANEVNAINTKDKVIDRINKLLEKGISFNFEGFGSKIFENNLRMIDCNLPEMLGDMVLDSYINDKDIARGLQRISERNPFNFDKSMGHDFYGYKMKSFLIAVALGMKPATAWNGIYDATGGYIIVKDDGDVICFHIYDRNLLEEYLVSNTRFETPTSDINKIGGRRFIVYKENDKWYFNLNLQVRFK